MKAHRILFEQEDLDFMREYKKAHGGTLQKFVREAVQKKIAEIKLVEDLEMLNRLKE